MLTTKKVRRTLVTWCKHGQTEGWLVHNPAEPCKVESTERTNEEALIIPSKDQLRAMLKAAVSPRDAAVIRLLMLGGLRISEVLGLADDAVIGTKVMVRERLCSRYVKLGAVKTAKSRRDVPIGDSVVMAVRQWRLTRGPTTSRLFPDPKGGELWPYQDFMRECWRPLMHRAGLREAGSRKVADFSPHDMRHVAVSLWIEQGLPPKKVQELAGHANIQITMDRYGHLWTDEAGDDVLRQASERLIG